MDFDNDFRLKWKKVYNKYVQIAMAQAIIVSCLFWGLVGGEISLQNVHEHVMNVIVMLISYTVSEGKSFLLDYNRVNNVHFQVYCRD